VAGAGAAPGPVAGPRLLNIPNTLTVTRLALVPVFVAFLAAGGTEWRILAFFVFGVASATDLLDGELARRSGMITDFGKIADPIADKALTGSALVTLSALGELSWWVTGVIIVREVGVTLLRFWVIRHGVIPASRGGKIKTVLQMLAIGLYILPIHIGWVRPAIMGAAVAVTLVTGADYVARAVRLRRIAADLTVPAADPVGSEATVGSEAAVRSEAPVAPEAAAGSDEAAQPPVSPPAEAGPGR
jgi:CDP-diacylglycerol---glycerol-3-phosphate 3-phosphatidyltransferase